MIRDTGFPLEVRQVILDRDGGYCTICGVMCVDVQTGRTLRDYSLQHRLPRRMGGTNNPAVSLASNGITLCGSATTGCHGYVEHHGVWAGARGYVLEAGEDPQRRRVLVRERFSAVNEPVWVYLHPTEPRYSTPTESKILDLVKA